jgi:hypothetical protein
MYETLSGLRRPATLMRENRGPAERAARRIIHILAPATTLRNRFGAPTSFSLIVLLADS